VQTHRENFSASGGSIWHERIYSPSKYGLSMTPPTICDGRFANEAVAFSPDGGDLVRYRKAQPFPASGERLRYAAGVGHTIFQWQGVRIAPFICYALRFPELCRPAARAPGRGRRQDRVASAAAWWGATRAVSGRCPDALPSSPEESRRQAASGVHTAKRRGRGRPARHFRLTDAGRMPAALKVGALVRWSRQAIVEWIAPAFEYLDYLLPNDEQVLALTGSKDLADGAAKLLERGVGCVAATRGAEGAIVVDGDGVQEVSAFEVDVVDSTGCGDSFSAGFLRGLALGRSRREAAVLGCATAAHAVQEVERDRHRELSAGHGEHVRRIVHDLVEGDEGKAKRHELNDWPEPDHGGADAHPGKSVFADRRVDDALGTKTLEQTLAHFVSALIFSHLFSHQKNVWIALEFFIAPGT